MLDFRIFMLWRRLRNASRLSAFRTGRKPPGSEQLGKIFMAVATLFVGVIGLVIANNQTKIAGQQTSLLQQQNKIVDQQKRIEEAANEPIFVLEKIEENELEYVYIVRLVSGSAMDVTVEYKPVLKLSQGLGHRVNIYEESWFDFRTTNRRVNRLDYHYSENSSALFSFPKIDITGVSKYLSTNQTGSEYSFVFSIGYKNIFGEKKWFYIELKHTYTLFRGEFIVVSNKLDKLIGGTRYDARMLFPFLGTYSDTLSEEERAFSYRLLDEFIGRHGDDIKSRAFWTPNEEHCPYCGEVKEKEEAPTPEKPMFDTEDLEIVVLIALMVLACPPLGVALIWNLTKWKKGMKIFLSILYAIVFFIGFILLVPRWVATIIMMLIPSIVLLVVLWRREPGRHMVLKIATSVVLALIMLFGIIGIFYYG